MLRLYFIKSSTILEKIYILWTDKFSYGDNPVIVMHKVMVIITCCDSFWCIVTPPASYQYRWIPIVF